MVLIKNFEWNDYFRDRIKNEISGHTDQNTIIINIDGGHYIHNALFFGMKANSIYFKSTSNENKILLENSRFFLNSDTSDAEGGNIFIVNGCLVQNKVCCSNCSSNSKGMHSYVYCNSLFKCSIDQCSFVQLFGFHGKGSFYNGHGSWNIKLINITNSENELYSCFYINGNNDEAIISPPNFKNNTSTKGIAIELDDGYGKIYKMLFCNIIEQIAVNKNDGIISTGVYLNIDSCVISNCKEKKYLQINLAEYETFINNKGVSISFYISSAYLTTLYATS